QKDANSAIKLISAKSNYLHYQSANKYSGVAVFSEIYYKNGWNAYIDGVLTPHFKVNYTFRAMQIPAGDHKIIFKFEPQVIKTGSTISLISFVLLLLFLGFGIYFETKKGFDAK
ncbi:MAG: YfhO family protein, partial [Flavobacterium sp.]|nr:YfhO family protein [Flavobacterium sp.]